MSKFAPIVLFTYNRLSETQKTIESLQRNFLASESDLFIYSDGPKLQNEKKVIEVRKYINTITGFKSVTILESSKNKGLANSIINGVSEVVKKFGKVIVLEDDLITSVNFLDFMNQGLEFYADESKIKSINGYSVNVKNTLENSDVHFQFRPYSWGWSTWANRWNPEIFSRLYIENGLKKFNHSSISKSLGEDVPDMLKCSLDGTIDSWYARWLFSHLIENKLSVYPLKSKILNIGFTAEGTHCRNINVQVVDFDETTNRNFKFKKEIEIDQVITQSFLKYFSKKYKFFFRIKLLSKSEGRKRVFKELLDRLF